MFTFDRNMLFVQCSKDTVVKLRNLATLEQGDVSPDLQLVDVKNATGVHQGVGFQTGLHATIFYFEEPPVQVEVPSAEPVVEEKNNEQNN